MKFKPGDPVKFARGIAPEWEPYFGMVGVVSDVGLDLRWDCSVSFGTSPLYAHVRCMFAELEPATPLDDRCSEFIADMNRFSVAAKKQVTA